MDPNMSVAFGLGQGLAFAPWPFPAAFADIGRRTQFILDIDAPALAPLLVDREARVQWGEWGTRLQLIADASAALMPEIPHVLGQVSIALRLWAGCVDAAKAIDANRPTTPQQRAAVFASIVHARAQGDDVYSAGVEAAPRLLRARGQGYELEGVPDDSAVRRFAA